MKTIGLFRRVRAAVLGIAAAGVGASAWAVGQLESGEAMVPALYRTIVWANATADYPLGSDLYYRNSLRLLFDGVSTGFINDLSSPRVYILLDLGTPHALMRFGVGGRHDESYGWNRIKDMKIAASNDGENWTDLFHLTKTDDQAISEVFTCTEVNYYPSSDTTSKYRYVKFYNFNDQSGHINESCVYSTDVTVEAGAADPFETTDVGSGDHPDGVLLSAKLLNAPDATYDLVAHVSAEDHGDDRAAWLAAADVKSVTLGEKVSSGVSASARVSGLEAGRWYWRAFAVNGETVVASDPTHPFSVGTTAHLAKMYVKTASIKGVYDGATSPDIGETSTEPWLVFDLSDLPKGKHLDSARIFIVDPEYAMSYTQTMLGDLGSSTEVLDWGGTVISASGSDRVVEQVSAVPDGITWTSTAEVLANKSPYGTKIIQWLFDSDTVSSRPRYLRLRANKMRFAEVELRIADDPAGLVAFSNDSEPRRIGTPSSPYGSGELAPGTAMTVSMSETDVYEMDDAQLCRLAGWTLTVTNAADEEVVTTSTAETTGVCTFTPAKGDKSASLVWRWKIWGHAPARTLKTVTDAGGNLVEKNGAVWNIEDKSFSSYPGSDKSSTDITWDLGSSRAITWFRFAPRNNTGTSSRYKDFVVYGSDDATTWTSLYEQGGVAPAVNVWHENWFATPQTYRYFRVGGLICTEMSEFWLYSDELMLKAGHAMPWASETVVDSAFADRGADLEGQLVYSPSGSAEVTVYAAERDYGSNLAAWQANGRSASAGAVSSGSQFTAHVAGLENGTWYWRAFATAGGVTVASSPTNPFEIGTKIFRPQAYVSANKGAVCDGAISGNPDASGWLVFDLSKIPAGRRLGTVRIWPRVDWQGRVVGSTIKFGYADGTEVWDVTKVVRDAMSEYPTSEASAIPSDITWGTMDEVFSTSVSRWMWNGDNVFEMPVDGRTNRLKPRYLYFSCDFMNVREVSLRLAPARGLVIAIH